MIPAFNAEATLSETLLSVLAQTYSNWEAIVVDDGSSDATVLIVSQYATYDQRIRLLTQQNEGPSAARTNGVMNAHGEIIAFLDSDDIWTADHLSLAIELLDTDEEVGVAFAPCAIVDADGRDTGQRTRPSLANVTIEQVLAGNPTATCSSLVVRKSVFYSSGFMRADMYHAEDQEWLFRVMLSGWQCRSHGEFSVKYRSRSDGLSSDVERMYNGWKMFVEIARRKAPDIVAKHLSKATASINMYYVRRLIRDRNYSPRIMKHFAAAWYASPMTASSLSVRLFASFCRSAMIKSNRRMRRVLLNSKRRHPSADEIGAPREA